MTLNSARKLQWLFLIIFGAMSLTLAAWAHADPAAMTDEELDAVSARGFSLSPFNYGTPSPTTTIVPFLPFTDADATVGNHTVSIANTTNVITAINQCIFSKCEDTGIDVKASPTTKNQTEIVNYLAPSVQNTNKVPTQITLPNFGGQMDFAAPQFNSQGATHGSGHVQKARPPLPSFGFGGR